MNTTDTIEENLRISLGLIRGNSPSISESERKRLICLHITRALKANDPSLRAMRPEFTRYAKGKIREIVEMIGQSETLRLVLIP